MNPGWFINFFISDLDANRILLGERGVPIISAVREDIKKALDPAVQMVFDYIGLVGKGNASPIDPPDPPGTGEVLKLAVLNRTKRVEYHLSSGLGISCCSERDAIAFKL